jgi:hypothetical protein
MDICGDLERGLTDTRLATIVSCGSSHPGTIGGRLVAEAKGSGAAERYENTRRTYAVGVRDLCSPSEPADAQSVPSARDRAASRGRAPDDLARAAEAVAATSDPVRQLATEQLEQSDRAWRSRSAEDLLAKTVVDLQLRVAAASGRQHVRD